MRICPIIQSLALTAAVLVGAAGGTNAARVPVVVPTNTVVTIMACNLPGGSQRYEEPQIRILQGLKPDIVALQEFNHSNNTPAQLRAFVDRAFGPDYQYFRESSGTETYAIPNGVISRFPIAEAGTWDDVLIPDRGFAWARIRLPGSNELYVVSVHFKASSGDASIRASEAANLRSLIQSRFPINAWVVVAGDLNTASRNETALSTLKTFLSDWPVPSDAVGGGNENTNLGRTAPYDYVLLSFSITNRLVPMTVGGVVFPKGLVFDSRVFAPLEAVPPVQWGDSAACQHMAVLKAVRLEYTVTNWVEVVSPTLRPGPGSRLEWSAPAGLTWTLESTSDLTPPSWWTSRGSVSSTGTNYGVVVSNVEHGPLFYRIRYP